MLKKAKKGQSLIEYGLIIAVVAVIAIAVIQGLGTHFRNTGQSAVKEAQDVSGAAQNAQANFGEQMTEETDLVGTPAVDY